VAAAFRRADRDRGAAVAVPVPRSPNLFGGAAEVERGYVENCIEGLIAILDQMDGDENLEPYLAGLDEFSLDDREDEDEHGGDIQDEPHDETDEGNDEPSLGWSNPEGLRRYVKAEALQLMGGEDWE
jgi:hypothetical protein